MVTARYTKTLQQLQHMWFNPGHKILRTKVTSEVYHAPGISYKWLQLYITWKHSVPPIVTIPEHFKNHNHLLLFFMCLVHSHSWSFSTFFVIFVRWPTFYIIDSSHIKVVIWYKVTDYLYHNNTNQYDTIVIYKVFTTSNTSLILSKW